jgi:hypothetical protein
VITSGLDGGGGGVLCTIVKVTALEVAPCVELLAAMLTNPGLNTSEFITVARSCVVLTKLVGRGDPFQVTTVF